MSNIYFLSKSEVTSKVNEVFSSSNKICFDQDTINSNHCFMISDGISALDCLEILRNRQIKNIVQNSIQDLSEKLNFLKSFELNSKDYFESNLSLVDSEIITVSFSLNDDRNKIIEKAFLLSGIDLDMTKYQYLYQVAAELVMNAQIDAPKLSTKVNVADSLLVIEKNLSKGLIAISTIDNYGSLDPYKMLENIYAAFKDGFRDALSKNSIGAGLGSAIIYEHVDSLFIGAVSGEFSRVSAVLPYGISEKKINQIQKSLHIIKG